MTTEFRVPDASCGHCKTTIETTVSSLADVRYVELDLATKRLTVEHGSDIEPARLMAVVEEAGYTAEPAS